MLVKPCKECKYEFYKTMPAQCKVCSDWDRWFLEAWQRTCEWIRRELEWAEERCGAKTKPEPKPSPDGKYTYREIVFGTVFTELWR